MISFAEYRPAPAEHRASDEDAFINALLGTSSSSSASALVLGAVEEAAGMWGRALASATALPAHPSLTPAVLGYLGHELARQGEAVFDIRLGAAGAVDLLPVQSWEVTGGPDPRLWRYRLHVAGPSTWQTVTRPGAGVVHCRLYPHPARPHVGRSPIKWAEQTGNLAALLERSMSWEASTPTGAVVPLPEGATPEQATKFGELLAALKGKIALPATFAGGAGDKAARPDRDWRSERLGPKYSREVVELRSDLRSAVLGVFGIPPQLGDPAAGDSGQREAYRRYLHLTVAPLGQLVAGELAIKLDAPGLQLQFTEMGAADISGRARAWRQLVGKDATMPDADARALVGLS